MAVTNKNLDELIQYWKQESQNPALRVSSFTARVTIVALEELRELRLANVSIPLEGSVS